MKFKTGKVARLFQSSGAKPKKVKPIRLLVICDSPKIRGLIAQKCTAPKEKSVSKKVSLIRKSMRLKTRSRRLSKNNYMRWEQCRSQSVIQSTTSVVSLLNEPENDIPPSQMNPSSCLESKFGSHLVCVKRGKIKNLKNLVASKHVKYELIIIVDSINPDFLKFLVQKSLVNWSGKDNEPHWIVYDPDEELKLGNEENGTITVANSLRNLYALTCDKCSNFEVKQLPGSNYPRQGSVAKSTFIGTLLNIPTTQKIPTTLELSVTIETPEGSDTPQTPKTAIEGLNAPGTPKTDTPECSNTPKTSMTIEEPITTETLETNKLPKEPNIPKLHVTPEEPNIQVAHVTLEEPNIQVDNVTTEKPNIHVPVDNVTLEISNTLEETNAQENVETPKTFNIPETPEIIEICNMSETIQTDIAANKPQQSNYTLLLNENNREEDADQTIKTGTLSLPESQDEESTIQNMMHGEEGGEEHCIRGESDSEEDHEAESETGRLTPKKMSFRKRIGQWSFRQSLRKRAIQLGAQQHTPLISN